MEVLWCIAIGMLGLVMYWTAIVVEPTIQVSKDIKDLIEVASNISIIAVNQNQEIIDKQDNITKTFEMIVKHKGNLTLTELNGIR